MFHYNIIIIIFHILQKNIIAFSSRLYYYVV